MATPKHPHSDSDAFDPNQSNDNTYELTTPSQDGLRRPAEGDAGHPGDSPQTFISDEFDPPSLVDSQTMQSDEIADGGFDSRTIESNEMEAVGESSQTLQSDEFDGDVAADSRTIQSDEFGDEPGADSRTLQSDEIEAVGEESRTFVSDEFAPEAAGDSRTVQSDEFDDAGYDSRTVQSDEFDDDRPEATFGGGPEIDRTFVSEEFGVPLHADTGAATMHIDIDGTNEDSRTIQSDEFGGESDDAGLMAQSNIRQTINPKSMDSADRDHWESVIRGALGSQAVPRQPRKRDSSLVGVGSNLNIQTRTIIEGQPAPGVPVDYRIETKLGEGGMGAVYLANQTSLNRNVALKVIKPISDKESKRLKQSNRLQTVRQHREGQFLSEAVVTGDLEHPNIVPIYDVAATRDGTVFYAMKCVSGTPWSKAIKKRSLSENVDILMKVCDALAFAHSRGVVHRDLKPENVMLGEFGVVLVMDWGLALVTEVFGKSSSVKRASSLGGSPAYMAPELATGPLDRIGPAADIYLIGAMLFEIITGRPPHSGSNVSQCLRAAATNKIDVPEKNQGELMDIALKAMATKMEERYPTVQDFQKAVRGYLDHAESIGLAAKAKADLLSARDTQQYSDYARAMFGFEQALDLWQGNEPARQGLSQAQLAYAEHALNKQDYELGLSLLDQQDPAHGPIVGRLKTAQQEQENRKHRLAWMKRVAAALLAVIFVGGSGALAFINKQKNEAVVLRDAAVKSEGEAKEARDIAVTAQKAAEVSAEKERVAKEAEAQLKVEAIALKDTAERSAEAARKSAEAEKLARVAADEAKQKAVQAAEKERLAKEAEAKLKVEAIALQKKAEESAEAEKQAKLVAVTAQMEAEKAAVAEKKAKDLAVEQQKKAEAAALAEKQAKELETKAKLLAVAAEKEAVEQRTKAEEERKKAEAAALAEKTAKELETKAKIAAVAAEQEAVAQRKKAEAERKKAEAAALAEKAAKELETKAKDAALLAQKAEEKAKLEAVAAKDAETKAKEVAIVAEQQAQYEAYVAKIGLAKARIDQNEFDGARELLKQLKADPETAALCGWEWSRLMHQASQSTSEVNAEEPARDVSFSETGKTAVSVADGGRIDLLDVAADGTMTARSTPRILLASAPVTAAIAEGRELVATGSADGVIRLFSSQDGREVRQLTGHTAEVTRVRFLNDGRLLSSSLDKTVRLWDTADGRELATAWHIAPVQNVAFGGGANPTVAAAVADARSGRAVIWQVTNDGDRFKLTPVGDFIGHAAPVLSVAVSADGNRVASGDGSGRIYIWNREGVAPLNYGAAIDAALIRLEGKTSSTAAPASTSVQFTSLSDESHPFGTLRLIGDQAIGAHAEAVRSLSFSTDGRRLVSAADDFTIKVWDGANGTMLETLRGHGGWVRSVGFSPADDDVVLSAGYDRSVKSWKLSNYSEAVVVDTAAASTGSADVQAHDDGIWSAHFSRRGDRIVTTSRDRSAKVWTVEAAGGGLRVVGPVILTDKDSPQGPRTLAEGHRYVSLAFQAAHDGRTLLIGGVDGTLRLFDVRRGVEQGVLHGCGLNVGFDVSRDGRYVLTSSSTAGVDAQLWELGPDGQVPEQPKVKLSGHEHPVTAFAISHDGKRLFTGDQKGIGRFWNAADGSPNGEPLNVHRGLRINDAAFLSDGRLVSCSDDQTIALYDPAKGAVERQVRRDGFVTMLSIHPDERRVLSVDERSGGQNESRTTLVVSDLATGQSHVLLDSTADGPQMQVRSARFSPDGSRVLSVHGGYDAPESILRLWSVGGDNAPQLARTLRLPKRLPAADAALLLADQANELVTLHGGGAFQWSLQDLEHHQSYRSHSAVTDAGFTSDGRFVATCGESVKIWDAKSGQPLFKLEAPHAGAVHSVEFTPVEGSYEFTTAGADGVAKMWTWDPAQQSVAPVRTLEFASQTQKPLRDAVYSATGDRLLTVGDGGTARVWDAANGQPLAALTVSEPTSADYLCAAFSSDGTRVLVGGSDKLARMWNIAAEHLAAESNPPVAVMTGHADRIERVAFLPSTAGDPALRALTASRDRSARVWDGATGREVISLRKHSLGVTSVDATRFGEAGETLVLTAALDGRLILWPSGE